MINSVCVWSMELIQHIQITMYLILNIKVRLFEYKIASFLFAFPKQQQWRFFFNGRSLRKCQLSILEDSLVAQNIISRHKIKGRCLPQELQLENSLLGLG